MFWRICTNLIRTIVIAWSGQALAAPTVLMVDDYQKYDQVVMLSDAHGNPEKVIQIFKKAGLIRKSDGAWMARQTLVIVNGDSIQTGNNSLAMLDFWIRIQSEMQNTESRLIHTLGNHELYRLAGKEPKPELLLELSSRGLSASDFIAVGNKYGDFLRSMPLSVQISDHFIIHSGDPVAHSMSEFLETWGNDLNTSEEYGRLANLDSPVNSRDWHQDFVRWNRVVDFARSENIRRIVMGHNENVFGPSLKNEIAAIHLYENEFLIKLDTQFSSAVKDVGKILVLKKPQDFSESWECKKFCVTG